MSRAGRRSALAEFVDQCGQSIALRRQISIIFHYQVIHRRRIPAHGCIVSQRHRLYNPTDHATDELPWRVDRTERHVETGRTMRDRLWSRHCAPEPLAVGAEVRQAHFYFFGRCRIKEILHSWCLSSGVIGSDGVAMQWIPAFAGMTG